MKKFMLPLLAVVALSAGCAGVHANVAKDKQLCWTGDVVEADAVKGDNWLSFNLLPSVWGGVGFRLNGDAVSANVFPLNAGADFVENPNEGK